VQINKSLCHQKQLYVHFEFLIDRHLKQAPSLKIKMGPAFDVRFSNLPTVNVSFLIIFETKILLQCKAYNEFTIVKWLSFKVLYLFHIFLILYFLLLYYEPTDIRLQKLAAVPSG